MDSQQISVMQVQTGRMISDLYTLSGMVDRLTWANSQNGIAVALGVTENGPNDRYSLEGRRLRRIEINIRKASGMLSKARSELRRHDNALAKQAKSVARAEEKLAKAQKETECFAIGAQVETFRDLTAIGGAKVAHTNFGTVENLTPNFIRIRNEHGNLEVFNRVTLRGQGGDRLTPSYLRLKGGL